jgi:acetyl-CoA acetyltransferase
MPASAAHRLLVDLTRCGYVRQNREHGDYTLTIKLVALGLNFLSRSGVVDIAQPLLDRLASKSGELVRLALTGEVDTALVYGFGKSSAGILRQILSRQTDPYTVAPLWPDSVSLAGLQARVGLDSGKWTHEQMAQVALDSFAQADRTDREKSAKSIDELLARPFFNDPLRRHDIAPITDGAAVIVLAAGDRARELRENPAWITGIEHRIETPVLGARNLTESPSTAASAKAATGGDSSLDIAELHAPFTHQHLILAEAIGIKGKTKVNLSGGALSANPMFVAGLERIGFAAQHIWNGSAERVLAHATSGPALQQNLVAVMEGNN